MALQMVWWSAMANDPNLAEQWASYPNSFLATDASNVSVNVHHLRPARGTFVWHNTQLVSVQHQPPSTPLLIHDTGATAWRSSLQPMWPWLARVGMAGAGAMAGPGDCRAFSHTGTKA
ncbi:hypothetical protein HaLaN_24181 [Haematococcus lacustris]|uniref:Uncharacterized protein n=1 Tax=Haematococcus lacustris TaxID=44745 RepID=A0A6A0A2J9_HAELA|nr:hypothetical protein HaLaN_24181 [Haematococcus lacustris]